MVFTPDQIESATPDEWTGKPTSLVYQASADLASFLVLRGLTVFSSSTDAEKDAANLNAVEAAEDAVRGRVRGVPVQAGQRLYLPAAGAYDHQSRLMHPSGDPLAADTLERSIVSYLEGIALIAEHLRAGTWRQLTGTGAASKKREETRVYQVERFQGVNPEGLAEQHPDVWLKLAQILPRLI